MSAENHAQLMDRIYRFQRYFYNFTRKYYLFGRDRLIRELHPLPHSRIIEIGCGTGRNLIRIAKRYPGVELYGLDASQEMLKTAREAVARAGLQNRIRLAHGYGEALTAQTFAIETFDCAIFSYSLSMIPDWRGAVAAAKAMLTDGGTLRIVDFGDLSGLGSMGRWLLAGWLRLFHVCPREEILHDFEKRGAEGLTILPGRYAFILVVAKR